MTTTSQEGAIDILREDMRTKEKEKEKERGEALVGGINCVILDLFSHLNMDEDLQQCAPYFAGKLVIMVVTSLQRPNLLRLFSFASFLLKPVTLRKCIEALLAQGEKRKDKLTSDKFSYAGTAQVLIVEGIE